MLSCFYQLSSIVASCILFFLQLLTEVSHSFQLSFVVSRKRRFFSAPYTFTDCNAASSKDSYAEIQSVQPADDSKDQYCLEQERETQVRDQQCPRYRATEFMGFRYI